MFLNDNKNASHFQVTDLVSKLGGKNDGVETVKYSKEGHVPITKGNQSSEQARLEE